MRRLWDAFAAAELVKPYRTEENLGRVRAGWPGAGPGSRAGI
ncbi:hypothetical protein [Nannocystis pusilla]